MNNMLKLRKEQMEALLHAKKNNLLNRLFQFTKSHAPQWCTDRNDKEIKDFISDIIEFAWDSNIFKEESIQQLILNHIKFKFDLALNGYVKDELSKEYFEEDYRLKNFFSSLASKQNLTAINLDTDLTKLKKNV